MSKAALERFYREVLEDGSLQDRLKGTGDVDAFVTRVVELGAEEGFDFTEDEVRTAIERRSGESELSEEDLSKVSGGTMSLQDPDAFMNELTTDPRLGGTFAKY